MRVTSNATIVPNSFATGSPGNAFHQFNTSNPALTQSCGQIPAGQACLQASFSDSVKAAGIGDAVRSEEHTSELQSLAYLVCRLLLEKKKKLRQAMEVLSTCTAYRWMLSVMRFTV